MQLEYGLIENALDSLRESMAYYTEGDETHKQVNENQLQEQDGQQRQSQVDQLPQLHGDDGERNEQCQADFAHIVDDFVEFIAALAGFVHDQADDNASQHAHNVDGHIQAGQNDLTDLQQDLADAAGHDQHKPCVAALDAVEHVSSLFGQSFLTVFLLARILMIFADDGTDDGAAHQEAGNQTEGSSCNG